MRVLECIVRGRTVYVRPGARHAQRRSHVGRSAPCVALLVALVVVGCGDDSRPGPRPQADGGANGTSSDATKIETCRTPTQGCPCDTADQVIDCGTVEKRAGDYVWCAKGQRTCEGETWGPCVAATTELKYAPAPQGPAMRLLGLGSTVDCTEENPCDPYCRAVTDDTTGVDDDPEDDVAVTDDGVTLVQSEVSVAGHCTGLAITPESESIVVTSLSPVSPNSKTFAAHLIPEGCSEGTPSVVWSIDRYDIATISESGVVTLVTPIAGPISVTAYAGNLPVDPATLDVSVNVIDASASPSSDATSALSSPGSCSADTTTFLYPYANTVFPLALTPPLVQWSVGARGAASGVKVSLRYPATGTAIFNWSKIVPENEALILDPANSSNAISGPRASLLPAAWRDFERTVRSNRDTAGDAGAIVLQRRTGSTMRCEKTVPIRFADGQLKGTVYYQAYASNLLDNFPQSCPGAGCTYSPQTFGANARFGAGTLSIRPGQGAILVAGADNACRVCHSASADGRRLVTNLDYTPPSSGGIWDGNSLFFRPGIDPPAGGTSLPGAPNQGKFSYGAIYPDGAFLFANTGPSGERVTSGAGSGYGLYRSAPYPGGMMGAAGDIASTLYSLNAASLGSIITPHYGTAAGAFPATLRTATPVFSADGTLLAFNHYAGKAVTTGPAGDKRSLAVMKFDVATKTFSDFRQVVTEPATACHDASDRPGAVTYYTADPSPTAINDPCLSVWPSFLPGNEGVVFEREVVNNGRILTNTATAFSTNPKPDLNDFGGTRAGCDDRTKACANSGTRAELWWVSLGATPVRTRLDNANGRTGLPTLATDPVLGGASAHNADNEPVLNYEPTVLPKEVGGYYWTAFSSRRLYGNVATMNPWWSDPRVEPLGGQYGPPTKKIWISAIDAKPSPGEDPSHPAFYLPGQELLAVNSKAYWVLDACTEPSATLSTANECETDLDCCNAPTEARCQLQTPVSNPPIRHCVPATSTDCIDDDSSTQCTADGQCCNFATGSYCASNVCRVPPPLLLYADGVLTRDFESDCEEDQLPIWQLFQWKADVPDDTSIEFKATSANDQDALDLFGEDDEADIGTAEPPGTTDWTDDGTNVDDALREKDQSSGAFLRVKMYLRASPDGKDAPLLTNWQVIYDCKEGV